MGQVLEATLVTDFHQFQTISKSSCNKTTTKRVRLSGLAKDLLRLGGGCDCWHQNAAHPLL